MLIRCVNAIPPYKTALSRSWVSRQALPCMAYYLHFGLKRLLVGSKRAKSWPNLALEVSIYFPCCCSSDAACINGLR